MLIILSLSLILHIRGLKNVLISHHSIVTRLFSATQRIERIISNRGIGSRQEVSKLLRNGSSFNFLISQMFYSYFFATIQVV